MRAYLFVNALQFAAIASTLIGVASVLARAIGAR
jgi:hypothetical protein